MIKVYKTFEISDSLWQQIADGFNECFEGHQATADSLKNGYCIRNQWGYGYHAIDFDDDTKEIRGFRTSSPTLYKNNLKVLVGGSTFVRKKYRKDIFIFYDLRLAVKKKGLEDGFVMSLGVPNKIAFEYVMKMSHTTFVGYLDYFMLPRNISKCLRKPVLRPLDFLFRCLANIHIMAQLFLSKRCNSKEPEAKYSLVVNNEYYNHRFGASCYYKYLDGVFEAYYRMYDEDGINTAYLLDFRENGIRTKHALSKAAQFIVRTSCPDAVLYVGFLKLRQHVLFHVPHKFVPRSLPLTLDIWNKSDNDKYADMSDKNNWDFSLMNFDVR